MTTSADLQPGGFDHPTDNVASRPAQPPPRWMTALDRLASREAPTEDKVGQALAGVAKTGQPPIWYLINERESRLRDELVVDFFRRTPVSGSLRPLEVDHRTQLSATSRALLDEDWAILQYLLGSSPEDPVRMNLEVAPKFGRAVVRSGLYDLALPMMAATGRLARLEGLADSEASPPLSWDQGEPYRFSLVVERVGGANTIANTIADKGWKLWGRLARGEESTEAVDLAAPRLVLSGGLLVFDERVARVDAEEHFDWLYRLRRQGPIAVPEEAQDPFLVHLATMPNLPEVSLPPELHWSQVRATPTPRISFNAEGGDGLRRTVYGRVAFEYGGQSVRANDRRRAVANADGHQLLRRDLEDEERFLDRLRQLGLQAVPLDESEFGDVRIPGKDLRAVVRALVHEGWRVEADGAPVRSGGQLRTKVTSGIDWFDLEAELEYDGSSAELPELLAAARADSVFVRLKDGSKGLAPPWLRRYASAAKVGRVEGPRLRFLPSQAGIIDALMTGHDDATVDVKFERVLAALKTGAWRHVTEPAGFQGKLRDYQREGLGWMKFLQDFQYGGCLADDMGLGKTVQVLAMLQGRHRPGGKKPRHPKPSLIVVPRSLVFNWIKEASKFCPDLKGVAYRGSQRSELRERLHEYDFVVTTYGTLRQDILHFLEYRFECVILDEAQAIKNPKSQAAKACRLLQADHRLAISGTPIENGLDELWSLFEFLNPGMLGAMDTFAVDTKVQDEAWLELLSQSLRPFMLRRTKAGVLKDLPPKTEQHFFVELNDEDRANYEELRVYYRKALSTKIADIGLAKAKVHVLEALLRLRQAACHPGLIDGKRIDEGSSKVDTLFENIEALVAGGHKILVFSQFTELLEICRRRLEKLEVDHEYLDGATRDRQGGVDRFQRDDNKKVFLISLKAGGCGLTLTASDYVFILDPWWNPAVEAQAVDRAYRMGQTRPVFAYRMIARDTVEEKIVALQDEKRRLADAIMSGSGGPIADLTAEDIERLFG